MLADRRYCYPLTITDFASRYLITCDALETTKETYAFSVFERAFKDFGLPRAIRTDNGIPFSCPTALYGLSRLSVWWLRLGIDSERIKPGHPEQNGRHERMHLTLKTEATQPASANFLQQQARFDDFIERFNQERPHQALGMDVPADREELRQFGYPLDRHANPMAAIHGVLKRLVEAGDASRVAYVSGTVYWWGSGPPPPPGSVKVLVGNLQQTLQAAGTVDPALVALVERVARQVRHVASQLDPRVLENLQDVAVRVQDALEVTPELEEQVLATATRVREIVARSLGGL